MDWFPYDVNFKVARTVLVSQENGTSARVPVESGEGYIHPSPVGPRQGHKG